MRSTRPNPKATQGRRRAFGQHFLKDQGIAERIAQAALELARTRESRGLLEIGPGRGAITDPLLARLSKATQDSPALERLLLCEKDRELARRWSERETESTKGLQIRVRDADFLALGAENWLDITPLTVVSNLPYSSGTAIFTKLGRYPRKITGMVLMFQSEVAGRLRAERGTKAWGSLSLWTQNQWNVRKLLAVPPGAFSPPPQVQSEVVVIEPLNAPRIPGTESPSGEEAWNFLLKSCFQHRRKMLRAGLPKSGTLRNALELSGVDDTKRAEALDWDEWGRLYRALLETGREAATVRRAASGGDSN